MLLHAPAQFLNKHTFGRVPELSMASQIWGEFPPPPPNPKKMGGGGGGKPNFEKTKVKNFFARGASQCVVLSITVLPLGITQKVGLVASR